MPHRYYGACCGIGAPGCLSQPPVQCFDCSSESHIFHVRDCRTTPVIPLPEGIQHWLDWIPAYEGVTERELIPPSFPRSCVGMHREGVTEYEFACSDGFFLDSCVRRNDGMYYATLSYAGMTGGCRNGEIHSATPLCAGMTECVLRHPRGSGLFAGGVRFNFCFAVFLAFLLIYFGHPCNSKVMVAIKT